VFLRTRGPPQELGKKKLVEKKKKNSAQNWGKYLKPYKKWKKSGKGLGRGEEKGQKKKRGKESRGKI